MHAYICAYIAAEHVLLVGMPNSRCIPAFSRRTVASAAGCLLLVLVLIMKTECCMYMHKHQTLADTKQLHVMPIAECYAASSVVHQTAFSPSASCTS